jgi:two-component system, cell cycle sensor histidine kinase and response regulator CckA
MVCAEIGISVRRYRTILHTVMDGYWLAGMDGRLLDVNAAYTELSGYSRDELLGMAIAQLDINEDAAQVAGHIRQIIEEGASRFETVHRRKDGSTFELEICVTFMPEHDGIVAILRDISERRHSERQLRENEALTNAVMDHLPIGLAVNSVDPNVNFRYMNDNFPKFYRTPREALADPNGFWDAVYEEPQYREQMKERVLQDCASGDPARMRWEEVEIARQGAGTASVTAQNTPIPGQNLMVSTVWDVTESRRMEEDLRRAHILESLGLLAGGIAHDFNNVLTGVTGNLALLQRLLDKDSAEYEIASEAQHAAAKTKGLTQQLMTFAQGGVPVKEVASVEGLLRETTGLSLRGASTLPEYHFAEDLHPVELDIGQIGQVIQNLVLNADQAMPNGGTLRISAENVEVAGDSGLSLEPGTYVKVSVEDQGVGISESILSQVFDPYFSTKETGHGLGLPIVHSIISRHQGSMSVRSEIDVGTTFEFYLPASQGKVVSTPERDVEVSVGTGRILLMDDEEMVRQTVGRMLELLGYEVESVHDGAGALRAYEGALESDKPFDVVIMDLTIPGGMGGREAVVRLHEIDPDARVIVSSGYAHDPVISDYEAYGFVGAVSKPVDMDELAETLGALLGEGSEAAGDSASAADDPADR